MVTAAPGRRSGKRGPFLGNPNGFGPRIASPGMVIRGEKYCVAPMLIIAQQSNTSGEALGVGTGFGGDPESEFMVADADVVAIVERCGGPDPLVLHMHAVR